MQMINLTQHAATDEQIAAGVVEPQDRTAVTGLLTFDTCPDHDAIRARAKDNFMTVPFLGKGEVDSSILSGSASENADEPGTSGISTH